MEDFISNQNVNFFYKCFLLVLQFGTEAITIVLGNEKSLICIYKI